MKTKADFIKPQEEIPPFASQSDREVYMTWMLFQRTLWEHHPKAIIKACKLRAKKEELEEHTHEICKSNGTVL